MEGSKRNGIGSSQDGDNHGGSGSGIGSDSGGAGWPRNVLEMQRQWIGLSEGVNFEFSLMQQKKINVFTTRQVKLLRLCTLAPRSLFPAYVSKMRGTLRVYLLSLLYLYFWSDVHNLSSNTDDAYPPHTHTHTAQA